MAWKEDAFQHPWDHLHAYVFPPFVLIHQIVNRVMVSIILVTLWLNQEWFPDLLSLLVAKTCRTPFNVKAASAAAY